MRVSVTDAKAQLTELVRRAMAGEEIVLTRHGKPTVRLEALPPDPADDSFEARLRRLEEISREGAAVMTSGPPAERAADFLYDDETGLPK